MKEKLHIYGYAYRGVTGLEAIDNAIENGAVISTNDPEANWGSWAHVFIYVEATSDPMVLFEAVPPDDPSYRGQSVLKMNVPLGNIPRTWIYQETTKGIYFIEITLPGMKSADELMGAQKAGRLKKPKPPPRLLSSTI